MGFIPLTIKVPEVNKAYTGYPASVSQNSKLIVNINTKYGSLCDKWGKVFDIPKGVLVAFIATESGGVEGVTSFVGCCYGLMQVSPASVYECATKFKRITSVDLPQGVSSSLSKVVPTLFTKPFDNTMKSKLRSALFSADFNIMCGTMILRWCIERFSNFLTGGQLNKAIVAYNAGAYTSSINPVNPITGKRGPSQIPIDTATLVVSPIVPKESRNYLLKMLGVDGFMYLIYVKKVI
jgi:soluble lytic murein transglycosylase-like protein